MAYDYTRLDALLERLNINWKKHNMSNNPDDTITRAQLKAGLNARQVHRYDGSGQLQYGYYTPDNLADSLVNSVTPQRRAEPPQFPGETVTFAELSAAFKRHGYADFSTDQHTAKLFEDIRLHREGYKTDDIVKSATGAVFSLQMSGRWKNYTDGNFVNYDVPARPLVKIGRAI